MTVLQRLSSATGDPSEAANKAVAGEALKRPEILDEIATGLASDDCRMVGNCAEVFTEVAKESPALQPAVQAAAQSCLGHRRANVRRLAQQLLRE